MPVRKSKATKKTVQSRASWQGNLTFGLVSFAVETFNAIDREESDIRFHQLHAKCHRRIQYKKVCPVHGEVNKDEIVKGYEYQKGSYVEIDGEELDAFRTESQRSLKVEAFVGPETIDPLYFDGRMYYVLPADAGAEESFAVFVAALEHEKQYCVAQIVLSGKAQLVLLRPFEGILHMAMLNFAAEIRAPGKIAPSPGKPKNIARQVRLAQTLIAEWSQDEFDFASYEDEYRTDVERLIKAKVKGKDIVIPEEEEEAPQVVNLMDALRKSLTQKSAGKTAKKKPSTRGRKRSA